MVEPTGYRANVIVASPAGERAGPGWRVGQILQAIVRDTTAAGKVRLSVGAQTLELNGEPRLTAGQRVQLQVVSLDPELRMRLLPLSADHPPDARQQALRELLPRQQGLQQLFQLLGTLQAGNDPRANQFPAALREALAALWARLPDAAQIQRPEGLQQAIKDSGQLFERHLAAIARNALPIQAVDGDLKGRLAWLVQQLLRALDAKPAQLSSGPPTSAARAPEQGTGVALSKPLPAPAISELLHELARQTDGALARIQTLQVQTLAADGGFPWCLELPVKDGGRVDTLQLGFERESDSGGQDTWSVRLAFDFEGWGPVHCLVTLRGKTVSTHWWAEQAATAARIDEQLPGLQQRLGALGFSVGGMRCTHGSPPGRTAGGEARGGGLIDERV